MGCRSSSRYADVPQSSCMPHSRVKSPTSTFAATFTTTFNITDTTTFKSTCIYHLLASSFEVLALACYSPETGSSTPVRLDTLLSPMASLVWSPCSKGPGASSSSAPPEAAPGLQSLCAGTCSCQKCKVQVSFSDSRPNGRDVQKRVCTHCLSNERNMQRRVKKRPAEGPFVKWWTELQKDAPKREKWFKRMRQKAANEKITDEQLMGMSEQVMSKGCEERDRTVYYGYEVLHDQMSLLGKDDEEIMEEWKKRVKNSKDKRVMDDGEILIARPREVVLDTVSSNMLHTRLQKRQSLEDFADLQAVGDMHRKVLDEFSAALDNTMPRHRPPVERLPEEALEVDSTSFNQTSSIASSLSNMHVHSTLHREMVKRARADEAEEREVLKDFEAERAAKKPKVETPKKGQATRLYMYLLEKSAKLEAHYARYREAALALVEDTLDFDLLGDEAEIAKHKKEWSAKTKDVMDSVHEFRENVDAWNSTNTREAQRQFGGRCRWFIQTACCQHQQVLQRRWACQELPRGNETGKSIRE